ncbi:MAG: tyrosine-type recombinase/integrase [Alphaproteobacteria bacterium]|nr:tyrosine-type recombinase/integrase [Alphaproteobacteria bacterium]
MPDRRKLTDAGIARLRAGTREYTVWDTQVAGLGVRVRPSGSRTFVYHRRTDQGVKKMSFGPAALCKMEEVRRACLEAAVTGNDRADDGSRGTAPLFRDFVAGPWKTDRLEHCKPSTRRNFDSILKRQLLPVFGARRIDRIGRRSVIRWFEARSRTAPGAANAALDLLGHILNHARALGHIGTNPTKGIRRNPGRKMTRFLSREEIARLHLVLDRHAAGSVSEAQQADTIRLLLLTGCRKGEIMRLRRDEVRDDRLELADSKTGPRIVLLNGPAREIVTRRMALGTGPWLFPSVRDPSRPQCRGLPLWFRARREAGIEDVRLHDLRHTVASQAAMNGVPLPVVARLLGHSNVNMTMRYAHVGDREIEAAAERVGQAVHTLIAGAAIAGPDRPEPATRAGAVAD